MDGTEEAAVAAQFNEFLMSRSNPTTVSNRVFPHETSVVSVARWVPSLESQKTELRSISVLPIQQSVLKHMLTEPTLSKRQEVLAAQEVVGKTLDHHGSKFPRAVASQSIGTVAGRRC